MKPEWESFKAIEEIEGWIISFFDEGSAEYYFPNDPKIDEPGIRRIIMISTDENGNLKIELQRRLYAEKACSTYIPVEKDFIKLVDSVIAKNVMEQAKILSQLLLSIILVINYGGETYSSPYDPHTESELVKIQYKNNKVNKRAANQIFAMLKSMTRIDSEGERELIGFLTTNEPDIEKLMNFFANRVLPFDPNSDAELDRFFMQSKISLILQRFANRYFDLIKESEEVLSSHESEKKFSN